MRFGILSLTLLSGLAWARPLPGGHSAEPNEWDEIDLTKKLSEAEQGLGLRLSKKHKTPLLGIPGTKYRLFKDNDYIKNADRDYSDSGKYWRSGVQGIRLYANRQTTESCYVELDRSANQDRYVVPGSLSDDHFAEPQSEKRPAPPSHGPLVAA